MHWRDGHTQQLAAPESPCDARHEDEGGLGGVPLIGYLIVLDVVVEKEVAA